MSVIVMAHNSNVGQRYASLPMILDDPDIHSGPPAHPWALRLLGDVRPTLVRTRWFDSTVNVPHSRRHGQFDLPEPEPEPEPVKRTRPMSAGDESNDAAILKRCTGILNTKRFLYIRDGSHSSIDVNSASSSTGTGTSHRPVSTLDDPDAEPIEEEVDESA